VAVKKDKILNYTNVLSMSGRHPRYCGHRCAGFAELLRVQLPAGAGQVVALLNLGASVMNINIVKAHGRRSSRRDVSVGGHQYTDFAAERT